MAQVTITLDQNDLGQIVDGLRERMESYEHTAAFFDDEELNIENAILEEVTDSAEDCRWAGHPGAAHPG